MENISYLKPGCGFGGSCFPKDIQALSSQGIALGLKISLLNGVLEVNQEQTKQVGAILKKQIGDLKSTNLNLYIFTKSRLPKFTPLALRMS